MSEVAVIFQSYANKNIKELRYLKAFALNNPAPKGAG
jgi:hypothetical protein